MKSYDHKKIESRIQKEWEKKKIYSASEKTKKPKFYGLIEFPYPSGDGLHVGHPRPYIGMDIISRKKRMDGFNVLYPIGWDAFGLPTENYAIKTGIHPKIVTKKNADNFRRQIKMLGISFDWSREINTTDPAYYKWTQWLFLQFFKKGLAYKAEIPINWCPKDKIGLANEEVIDGKCERCGTQTERRMKNQWMLAITKYADRLDKDLDLVDYPERVKLSQRNWIGKSEGSEISFRILASSNFSSLRPSPEYRGGTLGKLKIERSSDFLIKVFTTRADTLFGVTYVVLAPEHPLVAKFLGQIKNKKEVEEYIKKAKKESELERMAENKEKTGVELKGIKAINPANNEEVPVWIADYVLADYGTGAVMAVPAHDERDFEFAKKYGLEIKHVIAPYWLDPIYKPQKDKKTEKREVVTIIVRNPKDNTVLCLKWGPTDWQSFPTGGIDGEDLEKAARREFFEETGYKNLKLIAKIPGSTYVEFWRPHKGSNVYAHFHYLVFDLENEERGKIDENELKNHKPIWIPEKEVLNFINVENQRFMWQRFNDGDSTFVSNGILVDSGKFDGLNSEEAKKEITKFVGGKIVTKFKLRDWVFSRQRYWGEPIPVVNCEKCGLVPIPEKDLPLKLPEVKSYKLTETGESPLANISKWVNTKCPKCKGKAKRETDTMPNWAGSSWYYLRYTDPKNKKEFASKKSLKYWLGNKAQGGGVDWYNGGMEHTTLHLLYSRFWHKFFYDLKLVPTIEPYKKRTSHGMILGEGGVKMSKSLGNVVNPDDIVKTYGADTLRVYEMFMGPFEEAAVWNTDSIIGSRRFIEKVWRIGEKTAKQMLSHGSHSNLNVVNESNIAYAEESTASQSFTENHLPSLLTKLLHKTIKKVSEDIEAMRFNTAISAMMILTTEMEKAEFVPKEDYRKFLQLLAPFAPHITEDIWKMLGEKKSIHLSDWPKWDKNLIQDDKIKIAIQINGKVRAEMMIKTDEAEEEVKKKALAHEAVLKHLAGQKAKRVIYVKNRLINIVV